MAQGTQEGRRGGRLRLHLYYIGAIKKSQHPVLRRERWELDPSSAISPPPPISPLSCHGYVCTCRLHLLEARSGIGLSESVQEEQGVRRHVQQGRGKWEVEGELGRGRIAALVATRGPHTEGQHTITRTRQHHTIQRLRHKDIGS